MFIIILAVINSNNEINYATQNHEMSYLLTKLDRQNFLCDKLHL